VVRPVRRALLGAGAVILAGAAFGAGRLTGAPPAGPGAAPDLDYAAGLRAGEALGIREGRTLAEGAALRPDVRHRVQQAFADGYAAGANDVFNGYDGGWRLGTRYVITLARGSGAVTYRIDSRLDSRLELGPCVRTP
jgi:hypothetical protein